MRGAARAAVLLLIALAAIPTLLLGVAAGLALFLYAILEELVEGTAAERRLSPPAPDSRRGAGG